ncbi:uncharacterized protein CIMG_13219 [Coccidioides immitis RS]|uniref:Uncharacterized protein n=1 Tax=Coccidioides immitis (strain RS) TaxID=246410 RepID=J3K5D9_COCIM|nr:uncharacterized protein CIMG_13219 [Coccidioides immitis RS]EAS29637.3 hypothetical protein CIMG_13219 [Coccidioides immitis RS]
MDKINILLLCWLQNNNISFPHACPFCIAGEEQHKTALKEWALKKSNWHKVNKDVDLANFDQENPHSHPPVQNWKAGTHMSKSSVMAMAHCKHITVNTNNIKLVLDISAKIRSNYFSLIDASDHSTSAVTICHLCAAPPLPTTTATTSPPPPLPITAFLPSPSTIRVSTHQMTGIRAPVWFTKLVLEKQEEKKEKKKKKKWKKKKKGKKENDDNDKDDDNDD